MKKLPKHLGIIMDGNRRWAEERGLPALKGHQKGLAVVENVIKWSRDKGIKTLTLFAFSTENWKRPKKEVSFLMNLAKTTLKQDIKKYLQQGIKVRVIGQKERLPKGLRVLLAGIEKLTVKNEVMTLNVALSYGGRAEITEAIKNIVEKKIAPEEITEEVISQNLWTSDVDLLIRTGKEQRLSNFLIWQAAYSELYFYPKYWPDFTEKDLDKALEDFAARNRRHGK